MIRIFLSIIGLAVSVMASANSPQWMRYNNISPNGKLITFSYKGDIYVVDSDGGNAKQITTLDSYEYMPVWSPDSKSIAFASDRDGGFDVYISSVEGGVSKKLTSHSNPERPLGFSQDGKEVYYSARIQKPAASVQFPSGWITELYKVSVDGGRPKQVVATPVMNLDFIGTDGSYIYENRTGSENEWRKHHTSSVARDLYYYDIASGTHTKLTDNIGEDRNPRIAPDSQVIFLSERDGDSFNIYKGDKNNLGAAKRLTSFKKHPIRFLSVSDNGIICFGYQGEIYTMLEGQKAKKVNIQVTNDSPIDQIASRRFSSVNNFAMTPDGKQIVYTTRGEVFATTDSYSTTKQISKTPEAEYGVSISPDGKTVVYSSDRNGKWELFTAKLSREEDIYFANATLIEEELLFKNASNERTAPQFSPDGKEIAFIEDGQKLMVYNIESKKVREITDGSKQYHNNYQGLYYQWSPDSKWFVMDIISNRREPYADIAIVSASGDGKYHNITNSAYIDVNPRWALDGNAIVYVSNRLGMRSHASWGSQDDVFIAFLNQKAYDDFYMSKEEKELEKERKKLKEEAEKAAKAKEEKKDKKDKKDDKKAEDKDKKEDLIDIELDKLEDRIVRLTPMSSSLTDAMLSKDGKKLYFIARFEGSFDLWETNIEDRSSKILRKGIGYGGMDMTKDGKTLFVVGGGIKKVSLPGGSVSNVAVNAEMMLNHTAEREYMFEHVVRQQLKKFYKTDYHGIDLEKLKEDYLPMLDGINNNYDFADFLSEYLGELNVSHTGSGYRKASSNNFSTGNMGLLFDLNYEADGLKVDYVVEGGPFDKAASKMAKGSIITKIDGIEIKADQDFFPLLNGKVGDKVLVSFTTPDSKEETEEVIKLTSYGYIDQLLYERWIETRAEETLRLSDGRLGYVHIRSMDDNSYRNVYSEILGRYNHCEGIIIDTRYNGGGRLHEDIEILFSGEKYLEQVVRGTVSCEMPSRRYNKPSIMITCEANYSNAHGTPWVYKHKGMGSIVGMPVPGTMTSVNWETLQDPSIYFGIPVIGYRTAEGEYLENSQLEPDFKVENTAEKVVKGTDEQLEKAVEELLKQIDKEKK